jgi:hypothetical protein
MLNVPLDIIAVQMYKMDYELIENGLDQNATYAGYSYEQFCEKLKSYFDKYIQAGESKLVINMGTLEGSSNAIFAFESKICSEYLPFVLECDVPSNAVIAIRGIEGFTKTKEVRSRLTI